MKVDSIQHEKNRVDVRTNHVKGIMDWGKENDYPQSVINIVEGSHTGSACLDVYQKFIFGQGFADIDNYQIVVNSEGERADELLQKIVKDYGAMGGFALHINRNLLGQITELRHIPIENVRIGEQEGKHKDEIALHPDWGKRTDKRFTAYPIEYYPKYDADRNVFLQRVQEAGGIYSYKGEIFLYSNKGEGNYPQPIYEPALTDMSTQEAISNIAYRNSRHNFLPAGCFVEINENYDNNNPEDKEAFDAVTDRLKSLQGDKATSAIMHVIAENKEALPTWIPMKGENYDKEFTATREAIRQDIGQAFRQPEELRCEKTASGFSNDTMVQAYRVYNSVTMGERQTMESCMQKLFKNWYQPLEYNFQIKPLVYGSESILSLLGRESATEVVELIKDASVATEQKKSILMVVYGINEDEVNDMLNIKEGGNE